MSTARIERMPGTTPFAFALPDDPAHRDRLAELGQLASGLVHELKNPLGAIDLNVQMLQQQVRGDSFDLTKATKRLERIAEASRSLRETVEAFLGYARPGRPERERIDINDLLARLLETLRDEFDQAGIEATLHGAADLRAVPADPAQLRSVFLNILLNARDALAGRPKPRRILIATRNRASRISVVIANNGPPLDRDEAAHLFDPFFSRKEHGTGLGLAIVRRLVDLHRGRVWVSSDPDQGVSFTIELPTTLGPARARAGLPEPGDRPAGAVAAET